jgi:hypothetical protein
VSSVPLLRSSETDMFKPIRRKIGMPFREASLNDQSMKSQNRQAYTTDIHLGHFYYFAPEERRPLDGDARQLTPAHDLVLAFWGFSEGQK